MLTSRYIRLLSLSLILSSFALAEKKGSALKIPEQITSIMRKEAMPDLGKGRLEKILARYYAEGLGGPEHWEKISSLRVSGTLKLKDGEFRLDAYQKKPDLIKMTIINQDRRMVLAYDGKVAWQRMPGSKSEPELMGEVEARRFKHSARFGNHLLYPYAEGKTLTYIDTVPVEGDICHQIRVDLDSGFQVDYFINIHTYMEIKVLNRDLETGLTNSIIYTDYIREFGMPIAKKVQNYENGEWVSSLKIDEVKVNSGIVPWMFKIRSEK